MRRKLPHLAAALAGVALLGACSRHDDRRAGDDLRDAGHSVGQAAQGVAHNPDVRRAEADIKDAAHDAAKDLRQTAAQAKVAAHQLAADTRHGAHDVTRPDHGDGDRRDHDSD